LDLDELVEHWTLLDDERELIAGKRGPTRLGFALLLKFYTRAGRFPRGCDELPGAQKRRVRVVGPGKMPDRSTAMRGSSRLRLVSDVTHAV
jgi:hypothetical protein